MEESSDRTSSVLSSGNINKMNSDSGYGSNKSHSNKSNNSQSQRSSGSSKSHQSSLSSGSCSFLSHPNVAPPSIDQHDQPTPGSQGSGGGPGKSEKRRKKKTKVKSASSTSAPDPRLSAIEEGKKIQQASDKANAGSQAFPKGDTPQECMAETIFAAPADSKSMQMAALNHVLSCFKSVRDQDLDMSDDSDNEKMSTSSVWHEQYESMKDELNVIPETSFGAIVSMTDGLVVHITDEITSILGYPKDMWAGRSFMDLVHPKDKVSFANQFTNTSGLNFPTKDISPGAKGLAPNSEWYFCRLRQYRGLKTSGFSISDKPVVFFPFRLVLKLKEVEGITQPTSKPKADKVDKERTEKRSGLYLFIGAHRIASAYQYPEEVPVNPEKFVTRHSASCQFGHIDSLAASYLGHLPQDVVGQSVLDYYHPDDLVLLRDIYEAIMTERGKPFRSKPYRFRAHNGTFATLETDWSCFINPWSWKLEFVIGQHKVVKGPLNPNVFMPPKPPDPMRADHSSAEVKRLQDQIKQRLTETVSRRISDPLKSRVSRRKKDLTCLLETLLDQLDSYDSSDHQSDSVGSAFSVMERDSVMLGEISPHHDDHSGSNQSSETPPSYNQLNYRDNIERFFLSQPKTTRESDESGQSGDAGKNDVDDLPMGSTEDEDSKGSPHGSSASANRQSGNNSTGDNADCFESMAIDEHTPVSLTEDTLYRHNENMEKFLIKRHRETRGKNTSMSSSHKNSRVKHADLGNKHNGLKRTGYLAGWASCGSSRKAQKQPHIDGGNLMYPDVGSLIPDPIITNPALWPPYSVGLTEATTTTTDTTYTPAVAAPVPELVLPDISMHDIAALGPVTSVIDAPKPSANLAAPLSTSFVGYRNQHSHFMQTPGVSYALPGSANIIYHQPVGAATLLGQQHLSMHGPTQHVLVAPGAAPYVRPMLTQPSQLIPTVPGAIHPMHVGYRSTSNVRVFHPTVIRQHEINSVVGVSGIVTNPFANVGNTNIKNNINIHGNVIQGNSEATSPSSTLYPSTAGTSSDSAVSSHVSVPTSETLGFLMGQILMSNVNAANQSVGNNNNNNEDSSSSFPGLANLNELKSGRNVGVKASADFSSSDGFGDSSSGSLFSLLKTERSSEDSYSLNASRDGKDSSDDSPDRFHGDGDQDMMWDNQLDRNSGEYDEFKQRGKLRKPPWLENVDMTHDLSLRYQMVNKDMSEILQKDLNRLQIIGNQPPLVDEQLNMLYKELIDDGRLTNLNLEEGSCRFSGSFSSGSNEEDEGEDEGNTKTQNGQEKVPDKREISRADYEKIVQVYEENAPFPKRKFGI